MDKCQKCQKNPAAKNAIIDGKFGGYCMTCINQDSRKASAYSAQWHRDRDYEDHRRDVIQPKDAKGNINPEFIREYPEESKEIFTKEQIEKFGR